MSLPSISPPRSPSPSDYDNGEGFEFENENTLDKGDKDLMKGASNSNSKVKQGSSKKSVFEEVDDFFRESEFSCLADYLAEVEGRKNPQLSKVKKTSSRSQASSGNSASSSATNSQQSQQISSSSTRQSKSPNSSFEEQVKAFKEKNKPKTNSEKTNNGFSKSGKKKAATNGQPSDQQSGNPQRIKTGDFRNMIVLHIPEEILSDQLASKLIEDEINFQIVETPVLENAILYEHHVKYKLVGKDFQVEEKVVKEMDVNISIIFPIEKNLSLLQNEIEVSNPAESPSGSGNSETVTSWMKNIQSKHQGKKFTLLIQGLEAYLKKGQRAAQKEYRDRMRNVQAEQADNGKKKKRPNLKQNNSIKLNRNEIQNALIRLQLFTKINYRFYENASDLATHFYHYAKAISETIQKKEKDKMNASGFDWYAVADSTGGIPVEENGKGMASLWVSQLCLFPGIGQEKALAIARTYRSPRVLYEAYKRCSSVEEGRKLLEDLQITVGIGPFAKKQRLGPEASRRVYRFFTATDGKREIG